MREWVHGGQTAQEREREIALLNDHPALHSLNQQEVHLLAFMNAFFHLFPVCRERFRKDLGHFFQRQELKRVHQLQARRVMDNPAI